MAADALQPEPGAIMVLADSVHFSADLIEHVVEETPFEMLVPRTGENGGDRRSFTAR